MLAVPLGALSISSCCHDYAVQRLHHHHINSIARRTPWISCAGFCKQQLWPLFHYLIPLSPSSSGRFDPVLWQAYVKANKVCCPPSLHAQLPSRVAFCALQ